MPKQMLKLARTGGATRDLALDIVSHGRRGPGGTLRLGQAQIEQVQRTVGRTPEVMVKVSGGGRDSGTVRAHLKYVGRHGKLSIETDEGVEIQGKGAADESGAVSGMKKDEAVRHCAAKLEGSRWLPAPLRRLPARDAAGSSDDEGADES